MTSLRRRLDKSGSHYRVVKNTLARFAAEKAGRDDLASLFEGPVALAFGYGDIIEPARALADYIQTSKVKLDIKGGFLSDRLLTSDDVTTISTSPPREVLVARVLGGMQSPISILVSCLANPIRQAIGTIQARIQQMEGEA